MKTNSKIKNQVKAILADILALTLAGTALMATSITANASSVTCDNECLTVGKFYSGLTLTDTNGNSDYYYHFKSNDNEVWWFLTESELGFVPNLNSEYYFIYSDNGTTQCDPSDCECYLYDDTFISCSEIEN